MNPLKPREKRRIRQTHARRELLATQPRRRSSAQGPRPPERVVRSCAGCGELWPGASPPDPLDPEFIEWVARHQAHAEVVPTA